MIQHTISLSLSQEINLSLINTTLPFGGHKRSGFAERLCRFQMKYLKISESYFIGVIAVLADFGRDQTYTICRGIANDYS